ASMSRRDAIGAVIGAGRTSGAATTFTSCLIMNPRRPPDPRRVRRWRRILGSIAKAPIFGRKWGLLRLLTRPVSWQREDLDSGLGDQQGVLELRGPLAVLGDHRPTV